MTNYRRKAGGGGSYSPLMCNLHNISKEGVVQWV